ncbi:hypothetical protein OE88DRAFT_1369729 [Heliocybe sulcata]|uniref:Uncharacterized protein n=1 Tax=Heliocybe sulcata TaxID=5364 RepID=A0A5C3NF92_9AGAM|nr:hypothetical protein OE88DRAFT_1369729 [Heliocybe sulcata]
MGRSPLNLTLPVGTVLVLLCWVLRTRRLKTQPRTRATWSIPVRTIFALKLKRSRPQSEVHVVRHVQKAGYYTPPRSLPLLRRCLGEARPLCSALPSDGQEQAALRVTRPHEVECQRAAVPVECADTPAASRTCRGAPLSRPPSASSRRPSRTLSATSPQVGSSSTF